MEKEEIINKLLYILSNSEKSIRKAVQLKIFEQLFQDDEVGHFLIIKFIEWFKKYDTVPSLQRIFEENKASGIGPKLRIRLKVILGLGQDAQTEPKESEFESYVNELKIGYAKKQFTEKLQGFSEIEGKTVAKDVDTFASFVKDFGKGFIEIGNALNTFDDGEYSYTTHQVQENIQGILDRDLSGEKRFKIGHKTIDDATRGFRYGELLLILGNINSGKSMSLTNVAYNLWKEGCSVLLLTSEMRPKDFDERIYSRASAVDYGRIMSGKQYLDDSDKQALGSVVKEMKERENHIIVKYLNPSDTYLTIEGYINDLRTSHNFTPDVVILDSLSDISPLNVPIEQKDWQMKGQIVTELKHWSETCLNGRGVFMISTHQAKTETIDKKFEDINLSDFGRSKIIPERADFSMYIRSVPELSLMNVKLIKARRTQVGMTWSMAIDYSKCLVTNTDDSTGSQMLLEEAGDPGD
jgi:KaiC/GvpD/RAD55 family RecA-like ATPase